MAYWLTAAAFLLAFSSSVSLPRGSDAKDVTDGRLPRDLIPTHYELLINPQIDVGASPPFHFEGQVGITFVCHKSTNVITLNAQGLTIDVNSVKIEAHDLKPVPTFTRLTTNTPVDFQYFHLSSSLEAGRTYIIRTNFNGTLRTPGADGLYYDSYKLASGETKYIAATQFESINARNMFPCFDEVDMKATFGIQIRRRPYHTAVSNMPLVGSTNRPGNWVDDVFSVSPIMTTYVVCIVVGEFQYVQVNTDVGYKTPIRIYSTPPQIKYLDYALGIAYKLQKWLENTTRINYHTPKMDHIALPSKGGAMENWGLITYGEESLTVNPETSSIIGKQNVGAIISHELAHQWYGNLVTCKWWNDLWLNEGFATYNNYYPTEAIGWNAEYLQQIDGRRGTQLFLTNDARNTSDPIIKDIESAQTSESAFSGSTYPKGGAVVRMISGLMTRDSMEKAFAKYLKLHAYGNAISDQLFNSLSEQAIVDEKTINGAHINFKSILDPWLYQMGFPLLTMLRGGPGIAIARQSRFLNPAGQTEEIAGKYGYKWPIPITIVTSENTNDAWDATPNIILFPNQDEVEVTIPVNPNQWYVINPKQSFFYRVFYDSVNRAALVAQFNSDHTKIEAQSRSQIIDDAFTLARYGHFDATEAFDTTLYLAKEQIHNPWSSTLKHFMKIASFFADQPWYYLLENYMNARLAPQLQRLGWNFHDSQNILEQYLRRDVISSSCTLGLPSCLNTAHQQFLKYIVTPYLNLVDPNVLPTVLCVGVDSGTTLDWEKVWIEYQERRTSQIREERHAYLFGIACTNNNLLLNNYFNEIITGNTINGKDLNQAAQYLASTPHGADLFWTYLDNNWSNISSNINRLTTVNTITSTWHTQQQYDKLKAFIGRRTNLSSSQRNSLTQTLLEVQQNVQFTENNHNLLHAWLLIHSHPIRKDIDENPPMGFKRISKRPLTNAFNHWQLVGDSYARDFS